MSIKQVGMGEGYWDALADSYREDIFSVLSHDHKKIILRSIQSIASKFKTAADAGCGIGHFLPLLSTEFKHVVAYDLSESLLKEAAKRFEQLNNIEYIKRDFSRKTKTRKKFDFILCVNVLIMPSVEVQQACLHELSLSLKRGGHMLLVVPSIESQLLSRARELQWSLRRGLSFRKAVSQLDREASEDRLYHRGIVKIEDEATKHYLKEELEILLSAEKLNILSCQKLEYKWTTEFEKPPTWMKAPWPWDWCLLLKKG